MKYSISAGTVNLILSFFAQNGIDKHTFSKKLQLDEYQLSDPDARIPTRVMQTLWRTATSQTRKEQLSLEFGLYVNPYGLGIISYLLMNCATLRMALEKLCRYQDVVCAGVVTHVETHDNRCQVRLEIVDQDIVEPSYAVNSELSTYIKVIEALIGESLPIGLVEFSYDAPADRSTHIKVFGTENIIFSTADTSIWFPAAYLDKQIPHSNASLFPLFEKHLDDYLARIQQSDTMSYKVRMEIVRLLKGEEPKLIMVARALGIGERSIQLRLSEEGTGFRELLEEVRKELALSHLKENKMSTTDVSFLLGFSEPSVFSRTFKKWTGMSPNAFRKTLTS